MAGELSALDLEKEFFQGDKTVKVLNGVSVSFKQGRSYAIIGASGCGKSTLLHLLSGLDVPTKGAVLFDGVDIFSLSSKKKNRLLNESFGFVFQFHYLLKELTVVQNVMIPGLINGQSESECIKRAQVLLNTMGLSDKTDRYPTELSGGEQQRVSIARALFNKPLFLFADEPTGNLDESNATAIIDLLSQCTKEWGMGLIICSHDSKVYQRMEQVWRLHNGLLDPSIQF